MGNLNNTQKDFPILKRKINGHNLIYLDNVATTQKPIQVIDAVSNYYKNSNANVHRGAYALSIESSDLYEETKQVVANFLNANSWDEIIYTKNTTESLNLVAESLSKSKIIKKGSVILTTQMEHHSNIVPWQEISKRIGAKLEFVNVTKTGELDIEDFKEKVKKLKPKVVTFTHVSNVLGTINPVKELTSIAHTVKAIVVIDGAQAVPHLIVDVEDIDCDFYAFSGHKMLAPLGIGVLFGKKEFLEKIEPFLYGGDMISTVTFKNSEWNVIPWKFEAGTPNVSGAIGLKAAINYLENLGVENIHRHEKELTSIAIKRIIEMGGIIYGPSAEKRSGLISFNLPGIHPHDIATILDARGIAIRSGNHCAQPLMQAMKIKGTCRVGFYLYNTKKDVELFLEGLAEAKRTFK